jgi:hypothetical protein
MKVRIEDKEALSALSLESLRAYLDRSADWQYAEDIPGKAAVYQHTDKSGRLREVIVPLRRDFADYASRMADAVETLARVEDRSELDVYDDLIGSPAETARKVHRRIRTWMMEEHWAVRDVSSPEFPLSLIVTLEGGHTVDIFQHKNNTNRIVVAQQWGFEKALIERFSTLPEKIQRGTIDDIYRDVMISGLDLSHLGIPLAGMRYVACIYFDGLTKDALIQKMLLVVRMYELTRRTFARAFADAGQSLEPASPLLQFLPRPESPSTLAG